MPQSKSSKQWLKEHCNDPFVKQAQQDGWRSRAAYKLLEIQHKDKLIHPGMLIADLGAAPGGWSQVVCRYLNGQGRIFALDQLEMQPITGVDFLMGDFRDQSVLDRLLQAIDGQGLDLVLSDMAPNLSGARTIDQPRVLYLCELALDFVRQTLRPNGSFLVKIFQGRGFEAYHNELRRSFSTVVVRKPKASRDRSRECYLLAKGFKD